MNEHEVTICAKCKYSEGHGDTWYNWYCKHPNAERSLGIDVVTGNQCYIVKNDLGGYYTTDKKHPYCRDVNNGYCELYEVKNANFLSVDSVVQRSKRWFDFSKQSR